MKLRRLLILLVLLPACAASTTPGSGPANVGTPTAPPSSSPTDAAGSPIDGTWRIASIVYPDLVAGGLTPHEAHVVFTSNEANHTIASTLRLEGGNWHAFISSDGRVDEPAQSGTYTVLGHSIVMHDDIPGINYLYHWSIDGQGRLVIKLIKSNAPPSEGIKDDAFQYALYESQPLVKVG